jgi:hypothetical protein
MVRTDSFWSIHVITLQGVDLADPDDTIDTSTSLENSTSISSNAIASATGDMVIGFPLMVYTDIAAGDGATLSTEQESVDGGVISTAIVYEAGAASVVVGAVSSGGTFADNIMMSVNVNASAGGGATTLIADQGLYILNGQNNAFKKARFVTADQGSYALTGQIATLIKSGTTISLTADMGSYTINGSAAVADYSVWVDTGTFTVTGFAANLAMGRKVIADSGVHTIVGPDSALVYSGAGPKLMVAENGVLSLTGVDASLRRAAKLTAQVGTYSLSGFTVVGGLAQDEDTIAVLFRVRKVLPVSVSGRVKWVHYIPVQPVTVTPQNIGTFNQLGAIEVELIGSGTGLVEWVDYIPIAETADPASGRWRYDNAGWIPVVYVD